jgi:hypothetical protein
MVDLFQGLPRPGNPIDTLTSTGLYNPDYESMDTTMALCEDPGSYLIHCYVREQVEEVVHGLVRDG